MPNRPSSSRTPILDPPKTEPSGHTTARVKKGKKLKILVPRGPSLPEVFSGAGYRSFAVLTNPHHHEESGFPDLFDEAIVLIGGSESNSAVPYHDAQTVADEFLSWLKTRRDTDSPFLAYVHFMDPHNPYSAPDRFRSRYVTAEGRDRYINGIPSDQQSPSAQDLEFMRQNYDAEIAYFDETFSTLVGKTREVVNRPTVFVVTSDHGEEFMDHGGLGHGQTLHKEQVWVPLIFIGTQRNPARDHRLARHIDIAPTLAGIAGVDPDGSWEGRDLFGTVGASQDLLQEGASVAYSHHGIWSLTTDRWHYSINRRSGEHWLSDNLEDASGTENLAQLREDVVSELTLQMVPYRKSWRESQERVKVLQQRFRVNPANSDRDQVLENLRQLGYVE
jgi:arylsulfatase A-like enzyme